MKGVFLKLIAYALLAGIIYLVIRFFSALNVRRTPIPPRKKTRGVMVKDEICNTYLPKDEAIREIYQGREHFFCSEACRQKFLQSRRPH